jgi:Zn-dependent peptidase ImmA (M78 family)
MSQRITDAIAELYRISAMTLPTQQERVVVLNELLGGYNLTCIELAGLTSEAASHFLMQRGAIFEPIRSANQEPLAGYIYVDSRNGYIFVERDDLFVRRRFSVAHELGHYVLHFYSLLCAERLSDSYEPLEITEALAPFSTEEDADDLPNGRVVHAPHLHLPPYEQMEDEANRFAAELLMPAESVQYLLTRYAPSCRGDDLIWRLATEMLVSRAAMRRRLRDLHLLSLVSAQWN